MMMLHRTTNVEMFGSSTPRGLLRSGHRASIRDQWTYLPQLSRCDRVELSIKAVNQDSSRCVRDKVHDDRAREAWMGKSGRNVGCSVLLVVEQVAVGSLELHSATVSDVPAMLFSDHAANALMRALNPTRVSRTLLWMKMKMPKSHCSTPFEHVGRTISAWMLCSLPWPHPAVEAERVPRHESFR